MLYAYIPLALITVLALVLSSNFKVKFANALPVVLFSVIIFLYIFYVFNVLHIGRIIVISIGVLICFIHSIKLIADRERLTKLKKELFSHTFVQYVVLVALFFVLSSNKIVWPWDTLRLWGAYPKALYSYETLQLGEKAMLYPIMQSYPPGMPLLCYFMSSFSGSFDERILFITYDIFALALLLPIIDQITDKVIRIGKTRKFVSIYSIFAVLTVLLMPYIIYRSDPDSSLLYASLFIDPILGVFCGYHLSLCINKFALDRFSSVCVVLSGSCLVLMKDSAILFSSVGIIGGAICSIFQKEGNKKGKDIFLCAATSFAAIMAMWGSWHLLQNAFSVSNHISMRLILPNISQLLRLIVIVATTPATYINLRLLAISVSLPAAIFFLLFAKLFLGIFNKKTALKVEVADAITQIVCYSIFVIGYYFSFSNSINNGVYPSYRRYMCTLILCSLYILLFDIATKHQDLFSILGSKIIVLLRNSKNKLAYFLSGFLCVIFICGCIYCVGDIYLYTNVMRTSSVYSDYMEAENLVAVITDAIPQTNDTGSTIDIYLCIPGDISIVHHFTYFKLIDKNFRIKNFYNEANISSQGLGYSSDRFVKELVRGHYSYVVFTEIDDIFYNEYKDILGSVSVGDKNLIYSVDDINHSLIRL